MKKISYLFATILALLCDVAISDIVIQAPPNNAVFQTNNCPVAPCTGPVPLRVRYTGPQAQRIQVIFTRQEDGRRHERSLCFFDQIEGISCDAPPNNFIETILLTEGTWTATPQAIVGGSSEFGQSIVFTVDSIALTPADPVRLSRVDPMRAAPRVLLRKDDPLTNDNNPSTDTDDETLYSKSDSVRIIGQNLDKGTNPFLEVYLSPIPRGEPSLSSNSALPTGDWCLYQAEILSTGTLPNNESYIEVVMPTLPETTADRCTVPARPKGSIFQADWRWMIRDNWIRPGREHSTWAINTPRDMPWRNTPVFKVTKPQYPLIDGFGFKNEGTNATYKEFLTVFGNNAYVCVDCVPFVGCACVLPRIPDPLYHFLWHPIYKEAINSTNGSCNGMAATSLLMALEELQTETFDTLVGYPAGFTDQAYSSSYRDSNFCTPYCSPPKPDNLWAHIRMNHGVQISREFLFVILDTLGQAIFDPDSGQVFRGVPNETKQRIASNPLGHVACFFEFGNGHCVTPYAVAGETIRIYDNNNPLDLNREIVVSGGDYSYPARAAEGRDPNSGNALVAFPIDIWKKGRHILGLSDIQKIINGDVVKFLTAIVVGDAEMEVVSDNGALGFDHSGARTDFVPGGFLVPLMGPSDVEQRNPMAVVAMNQQEPLIRVHAKGSNYTYQTGAGGHLIQLHSAESTPGDTDEVRLAYQDQALTGITFQPQSDANKLTPQVGLAIDEGGRALFRYSGVRVRGSQSIGLGGNIEERSVQFVNNSGTDLIPVITLDRASGDYVRANFGPINIPAGATHKLLLSNWPNVDSATSTLDLDSDGIVDATETIDGHLLPTPENLGQTADLVVELAESGAVADGVHRFSASINNVGPDSAASVTVRISISNGISAELLQSSGGNCVEDVKDFVCSYSSIAAGGLESVQLQVTMDQLPVSVLATVFATSRDPDSSNDSRLLILGQDKEPDWKRYLWWLLIALVLAGLAAFVLLRRN